MDAPIARGELEGFEQRILLEIKRIEEAGNAEDNRQNQRINALEKTTKENRDLLSSIKELAVEMKALRSEQQRQGNDIEALKARDGEKWRDLVKYFITFLAGAVLTLAAKNIGLM